MLLAHPATTPDLSGNLAPHRRGRARACLFRRAGPVSASTCTIRRPSAIALQPTPLSRRSFYERAADCRGRQHLRAAPNLRRQHERGAAYVLSPLYNGFGRAFRFFGSTTRRPVAGRTFASLRSVGHAVRPIPQIATGNIPALFHDTRSETIDQAQADKKRPHRRETGCSSREQRVLDYRLRLGRTWRSYLAKECGVERHRLTLSVEQLRVPSARAAAAGLATACASSCWIPRGNRRYDRIV